MRTHVALLRGINLGGHNRVAMGPLRELVSSLGYGDVATYVQSGNVVFTAAGDPAAIADRLEAEIAPRLGVACGVVVLERGELAAVVEANPFRHEADDRKVHAVFRRCRPGAEELDAIAAAEQRARDKGSRDEATVVNKTLYLWTPDGFGRSELATQLLRLRATGTARNWRTVGKLRELLDA